MSGEGGVVSILVNWRERDPLRVCWLLLLGLQDNVHLLGVLTASVLEFAASESVVHSLGLASTHSDGPSLAVC